MAGEDVLRIGISACFMPPDPERNLFRTKRLLYIEESYAHYVMSRGAMPVLLPTASHGFALRDFLRQVDGLMLQGGADLAPESYGQEALRPEWAGDADRDAYETELVAEAIALKKPVLGICRGAQMINVCFGGTLYQDIKTQVPEALLHRDADLYDSLFHQIKIESDSGLAELYPGQSRASVTSVHHQGIDKLGEGLRVEARSAADGIIEAIRFVPNGDRKDESIPYVFGVQWHPEFHRDGEVLDPAPILNDFLDAARKRRAP